jgi:hypothetical protein
MNRLIYLPVFLFCLISGSLVDSTGFAQIIPVRGDSIALTKPKPLKNLYTIETTDLQEFEVTFKKPKPATSPQASITRNLAGGAITLFSGLSTGVTETSMWLLNGELLVSNPPRAWHIPLFFQGTYIKERKRVKNEDGSTSVDVRKGLEIDWNQESYGFIFENQDTVGFFTMITNIQERPEHKWLRQLSEEGSAITRSLKGFTSGDGYSFVIKIAFRNQLFTLVTDGSYFRTAILLNDIPVAVFQSNPTYLTLNKQSRLNPYIIFTDKLENQTKTDLLSLAMMNILMREIIAKDFYQL